MDLSFVEYEPPKTIGQEINFSEWSGLNVKDSFLQFDKTQIFQTIFINDAQDILTWNKGRNINLTFFSVGSKIQVTRNSLVCTL